MNACAPTGRAALTAFRRPEGEGTRTTPERLADLYAPALQALLTGSSGPGAEAGAGPSAGADDAQPGYGS